MSVVIPESALEERFLAGTGPGGQNVNKVATAVQLRLDAYALGLAPDAFRRLKLLAGSRWTQDGGIVVVARGRTREANREAARTRLQEMVDKAHERPERRVPTRPSRSAKAARVEGKARRGVTKRLRGKVALD